jgi:hypothetical protein
MSNVDDVNDGQEEAFIKLTGGCIMKPIMLEKRKGCNNYCSGRMWCVCGGEDALITCEEEEGPTVEVFCYPAKVQHPFHTLKCVRHYILKY